jgi:hypothetical protein
MAFGKSQDRQLVKEITKVVKAEQGRGADVQFDPNADAIHADGKHIQLGNIRRIWGQLDKRERSTWLRNTIGDLVRPSPIPDVLTDTSALRPGLRSGSYFEASRLIAITSGMDPTIVARRPFVEDLYEVLLWDLPSAMSVISEDTLASWSRPIDELLPIASQNLAAVPRLGFAAIGDRVFRLINGDDYDSARLLLPEVLDELPLHGDIVGLIPTRNSCLFVRADDAAGIRMACELALQDDNDVPLFHHPLVCRDGEWSLLRLEETHDAYKPWRTLTRIERAHAANDVQKLLQEIVGDEIFVASVGIRESPYSGLVDSIAVWTRDVPTLLPQADVVAFNPAEDDGTIVEASWGAVTATVGDQMVPTEHYPMRWRVEGYPTPAQLSAMERR